MGLADEYHRQQQAKQLRALELAAAKLAGEEPRPLTWTERNVLGVKDPKPATAPPLRQRTPRPDRAEASPRTDAVKDGDGALYEPRPIAEIKVRGTLSSVRFDGEVITVRNAFRSRLQLEHLRTIVIEDFGIWFGVVGAYPPERSFKAFSENPSAVVYSPRKRPQFEALVETIEAHRISS